MGDGGSLKISENPSMTAAYHEDRAPDWGALVQKKYLREDVVEVCETCYGRTVTRYGIPVTFNKKIHQPHLENFFNAIRGKAKLNCPADEAFASEAVVFKANEAIAAQRMLEITKADTEA